MRTFLAVVALLSSACSAYMGSATTLSPKTLSEEPGWVSVRGVQPLRQKDEHDCGPTALNMVLNYYQPERAREVLADLPLDRQASAGELRDAARRRGLSAFVVEGEPEDVVHELEAGRPVIVGMAKRTVGDQAVAHYEVVVGMHRGSRRVATYDPAAGVRQNSFGGFLMEWKSAGSVLLVIMPKATATEQANGNTRSTHGARAL
ncbi:MAG TPA: C39 family peptidase [Polyangiales bacterium]|nr:C39 family peptidase [Polyangiales bacterium]